MIPYGHFLRWSWACLLRTSGALLLARRRLVAQRCAVVLTFHRVLDEGAWQRTCSLAGILLRRTTFEQLAGHAAKCCDAVDAARARPGRATHKPQVVFTFDDGWGDNLENALPVTRALGIPITIFICPALVGRTAPFWPERVAASLKAARPGVGQEEIEQAVESLKACAAEMREWTTRAGATVAYMEDPENPDRTLGWEEIREMARDAAFGAHTDSHQILTLLPEREARMEITRSKAVIERQLNRPCTAFAYPNGNWSGALREIVKEAGFELAFTTQRGPWTERCDPLAVPRMHLAEDDVTGPGGRFSPAMFEYNVFWRAWRARGV